jgi:hypothetical protein
MKARKGRERSIPKIQIIGVFFIKKRLRINIDFQKRFFSDG